MICTKTIDKLCTFSFASSYFTCSLLSMCLYTYMHTWRHRTWRIACEITDALILRSNFPKSIKSNRQNIPGSKFHNFYRRSHVSRSCEIQSISVKLRDNISPHQIYVKKRHSQKTLKKHSDQSTNKFVRNDCACSKTKSDPIKMNRHSATVECNGKRR